MDVVLEPKKLSGTIEAIPSKSYAQRILLAAALCDEPTEVSIDYLSDDVRAMQDALAAMKVVSNPTINCRESGTTARLLLPVLCALFDGGTLTGEGSLLQRPFATLCKALEPHGVSFDCYELPITWSGRLKAGQFELPGDESSQYLSGLLFALPLLDGESDISLTTPLESAGYVDMTLDVLRQFGINVLLNENYGQIVGAHSYAPAVTAVCDNGRTFALPKMKYGAKVGMRPYTSPGSIAVEGDWSNAAFWLAAGVEVEGLNPDSLQRDRAFVRLKQQMEQEQGELTIDATDIPDLVPILSVCAARRQAETHITGIKRLRLKESDRIATTVSMLESLGVTALSTNSKLIIRGSGTLRGGTVDGANDHRIVMAAAIAASHSQHPVTITGAQAVAKTYARFFEDYARLGGKIRLICPAASNKME